MSTRVFVLLELVNVDSTRVARILRIKPGVAMVNLLEGPPDLILAIEAPERLKAGKYLMEVLDSVNGFTENLRILPVCEPVEERPLTEDKPNSGDTPGLLSERSTFERCSAWP